MMFLGGALVVAWQGEASALLHIVNQSLTSVPNQRTIRASRSVSEEQCVGVLGDCETGLFRSNRLNLVASNMPRAAIADAVDMK
jgi:hypothetical protein